MARSATLLAAIDAGVDAVDAATATMAGTTSQPSLSALVAATDGTERETGLDIDAVFALEPYWEAVRRLYAPFESGLASPTGRVYFHEIPGGQLSNLRQQAIALGLGDRFEDIENMYAAANRILGNLVKVTPSSKVVGDLALALVGAGADPADFEENPTRYDIPDSVIGFLEGELGDPPGGWPEPFRSKALEGRRAKPRVTELTAEQEAALVTDTRRTLNHLLFPGPTREFEETRELYGDLSRARHHRVPPRARARPASTRPRSRPASGCSSASARSATPTGTACARSCAPSTASSGRCRCATARCRSRPRPPRRPTRATPGTSPRRSRAWSRRRWPRATPSSPAASSRRSRR